MTAPPLPYFFDEAELASNARQPGDREKALKLTLDDLKWLNAIYLATDASRVANKPAMHAARLLLTPGDGTAIPLAGAFAMSKPDDGEATLYTPWKGLIKFADMAELKAKLQGWLKEASDQQALLRFLSIEQRTTVSAAKSVVVSTQPIDGAVFQDQQLLIEANQQANVTAMLGELVLMPTLRAMLDQALTMTLRKPFPTLDPRLTRLDSFSGSPSDGPDDTEYQRRVSSLALTDAVLHYYLTNQWPDGDYRRFTRPGHHLNSDADHQAWESAIKEIAQSLTPYLRSQLETFWNSPMANGLARSAFFAESLQNTYCVDALLKRQQGLLSAEEYQLLMNVLLAGTDEPQAAKLRIDKPRITAPFKHYVELAHTVMISDTTKTGAFLYSQRGIEATSTVDILKSTVLAMLDSAGHEDHLLQFLHAEERGVLLSLEATQRQVLAEPLSGPVFPGLMADILGKQMHNLSFALSRYRENEGRLAPHALIDNALDVRALLDKRLLAGNVNGRWSTRADQRWSARPATVRAESAKQQLTLLTQAEQALDRLRQTHPPLPSTVRTLSQAQAHVATSLEQLRPTFTQALATALRSELQLRGVTRTLDATDQAILETVLDTPVRQQRGALNGFLPDVFSLALKTANDPGLLPLASCFVLTERGGLDPVHSGKALLWTPARGFEAFSALPPLLAELQRRLRNDDRRPELLENLPPSQRQPGHTYTLAPLQLVHGHFLEHVQNAYVDLDQAGFKRALATPLPATPQGHLLKRVALRTPQTGLQRPTDIVQSLLTQQKLPAWLARASIEDQIEHAELLQQYLNNAAQDKDYLSDIPTLPRTAHKALHAQLKADTFDIDPDTVGVQVKSRLTAVAETQTLSAFALTHLHDLDRLSLSLSALGTTALSTGLDETYVKDLVRNLNPGQLQQALLSAELAETHADAKLRRQRFAAQVPWQLMHYAHGEKLQERLSQTGYDFVRQIMDMPDALAREAVKGANAIIRPLALLGAAGTAAIKTTGVYLIGPGKNTAGPVVLLAPYSPRHGLKEYASEDALLEELKSAGALQDWVLKTLPVADRARGKSLLSDTVSLASSPIKGALFKHLFNDNAHLLEKLLGSQSDNDHQGDWATIKRVLGEDLDQAFTFLTGKLAYPLTVWRSYREIKVSAEALQQHRWGLALKAFISGIAQLAMLRQSMEVHDTVPSSATEPPVPTAATPWHDIDITAVERTRLQRHESTDTDLSTLLHDTALGLYTEAATDKTFGAVDGKVYPLKKCGKRWRIHSDNGYGPYLRQLGSTKQWGLEIQAQGQAPRFGMLRRLRTWMTVQDGMNVEAEGMEQIRQLFPVRARLIDESLDLATTYAWNSLQNLRLLNAEGDQVTAVHRLIMDFIDVPKILPEHVTQIEKVVEEIFAALLHPSLRDAKSKRLAVGRVTHDREGTFGFTVPSDPEHRIYLAEKFFLPNFDHYRNYLTDAAFPIRAHARAATLIHELSHIVCKTEDISYLDVTRPFVDLIETTTPRATLLRAELTALQNQALSSQSPMPQLFSVFNSDTQEWEDLGDTLYEDTSRAMNRVVALTGQLTIADARETFKRNAEVRLAVQLANADSVSWLITHLGRQLHTSTP
ncbi:hypothetical protein HKK52_05395 [Pseudomonas sp. ADAK2]|uniref:dermonecrotic toxin domain-containing protein n=1 Tax=unclassified Pseudomonas TaxID=196821 RepID=UPI0014646A0F|nr:MULTISPECIES: DUF6543 domain-containing protein [unclassified Pseudomonas]QJI40375.1 hypothetical protein HKK53_05390 [Pseudomonas sp. ADAK7]QJI46680.1 hypothetical protein HKK52_05395 [Pseudomonas sp. ADAK2]